MSYWISLNQLLSQIKLIMLTLLFSFLKIIVVFVVFVVFNIGFVTSSTCDQEILDAAVLHDVSTWSWYNMYISTGCYTIVGGLPAYSTRYW